LGLFNRNFYARNIPSFFVGIEVRIYNKIMYVNLSIQHLTHIFIITIHHFINLYVDGLRNIQVDTYIKIKSAEEGLVQKRHKATAQKYKFTNKQRKLSFK